MSLQLVQEQIISQRTQQSRKEKRLSRAFSQLWASKIWFISKLKQKSPNHQWFLHLHLQRIPHLLGQLFLPRCRLTCLQRMVLLSQWNMISVWGASPSTCRLMATFQSTLVLALHQIQPCLEMKTTQMMRTIGFWSFSLIDTTSVLKRRLGLEALQSSKFLPS